MKLNYINGKWIGDGLEALIVKNPATNEVVGEVAKGGTAEAELAVEAAADAFESWSNKTAYERGVFMDKLYNLMIENKNELAEIMTTEMGKPLEEAKGEVVYAANFIDWFKEEGKRIYGETIPTHDINKRLQVWRKPVGVVAAITPWNFPIAMLTRKIGPALAAGCTVVMKPSSESPLSAIKLVELAEEAGFPPGVINVVVGSSREIGEVLLTDKRVKKVTFTGSTEVGKQLMAQGASTMKKLSLELGGHAPVIVYNDADIEKAVAGTIASKFRNAGQTCICANRVYVQSGIHDEFVGEFTKQVAQLKIGPLINKSAVEKVELHVEDAVKHGAEIVLGGNRVGEVGHFYAPTVIQGITSSMLIMNEETFGPIAPIYKFETDEEAVVLANDTNYGLAAYVFTESLSRGMKAIEKLDYGIVGWNDGAPSATQAPFGGMKESGLGREGGRQGIEDFLETQFVSIGI